MTTNNLPATPDGWVLGTDCGYPNHAGFVKDAGNMHWSLVPADGSDVLWVLTLIDNKVAISTRTMSLEAALDYTAGG